MEAYDRGSLDRRLESFTFLMGHPYLCLDNETFFISTRNLSKLKTRCSNISVTHFSVG